jgi:HlyD family secretion protein
MKRRYVVAGALAAAAVGVYAAYAELLGPAVVVEKVVHRDVVQSVVASGRIAAPFRVDIGSQVVGTVADVPVAEGQAVKAGQLLIRLESSELLAGVKQGEVAVAQAQARLRQLRELQLPVADQALRQAEANFANAQAQYDRNKRLFEGGFLGRSAFDDAQRNLDVARTQVATARKQLETAQPSGSDSALAVAALEQAKANLLAARAKLEYTTIEAPRDGTLIARDVERGHVVQPGKVLMVLSPSGETQIVLQIDERNLGRLAVGQKALASADAFAQQRFGAELVYINPGVDAQRGTVEVKLRVAQPPAYLKQDMTVSVDIEVGRSAGALTVPAEAVHDATGAAPWVMRVADGRAERRQVKLGLRGDSVIEVREGLQAGDAVLAGANPAIRAGQRVRPHVNG